MTHLEIAHICNYSTIYRQRCISIIHFISRSFFPFFHPIVSSPIQLLPRFSRHSCLSREEEEEKTLIRLFSGISRLVMALKAWNGTRHVRSRGYEGKSVARITYVLASRILTLKVKEVGVGNADEQATVARMEK